MPQKIIGSGQSFDSTLTVLPELQEGHFGRAGLGRHCWSEGNMDL
jgi:hypothetical protein